MERNVPDMTAYAQRINMTLEDLDALRAVHVSGTKGKGSTCAFVEHILRNSGYKTGFYSSPHLTAVRERIRINGRPLTRDNFTHYFWMCWNLLKTNKVSRNMLLGAITGRK